MSFVVLKSIWSYRGFILSNIKREFQIKYQNSLLGAAWNIINPLAMIVIYTVIFSRVMQAKLPGVDHTFAYSIYLCSGIFIWALFSEIIARCQTVFIENANLIKKINFPKLCLPIIVICTALLNFFMVFGLFTLFLIFTGHFPGLSYISLVPVLLIFILFSIGLGIILGVLNVFFRDVGQFFGIALQFWFWLTPIVYPIGILPQFIKDYMLLNPMVGVVLAFQRVLVHGDWPNWAQLWPVTLFGIVFAGFGFKLFREQSSEIVDEL